MTKLSLCFLIYKMFFQPSLLLSHTLFPNFSPRPNLSLTFYALEGSQSISDKYLSTTVRILSWMMRYFIWFLQYQIATVSGILLGAYCQSFFFYCQSFFYFPPLVEQNIYINVITLRKKGHATKRTSLCSINPPSFVYVASRASSSPHISIGLVEPRLFCAAVLILNYSHFILC